MNIFTKIVDGATLFCDRTQVPHYRERYEIGSPLQASLICHDYLHYRFGLFLTGRFDDDERIEEIVEEIQGALTYSTSLEDFYEELEHYDGIVNYRKIKQKEYEVLHFVFNRK